MDYPAELVDELCSRIYRARKGKIHKTRAYQRAMHAVLDSDYWDNNDAYEAISACAWANGADNDCIDMYRAEYLAEGADR
jgi:hypothetical protein